MQTPTHFSPQVRTHGVLMAVLFAIGCTITTQKNDTATPPKPSASAEDKEPKHAKKPKAKPKSKPKPKPEPEVAKAPKPKPPEPAPEVKQPPVAPTPPPPPQPEQSQIVLPVKVDFDALLAQIETLVPKTDKQDWTPITKGDDSPKAEVKYQLWRDPIKISFSDQTFHITVPVHYAATVRAQVKNPFSKHDWIWIAKNETWGTREDPQRITATIDAEISVDDSWKVKSKTKLDELKHGEPPPGKICKNAGIQICVSKEDVAPKVRKGMDAYLRPRLEKALAKVDAQVQKAFDLKARAQSVWSALQAPQSVPVPGEKPAWLVVQPSAVGVGPLHKEGSALQIDLSIAGRIAIESGKKPKLQPVPLPNLSTVTDTPGFHVIAELRIPSDTLSAALARELKGVHFGDKGEKQVTIASAQVLARTDDKHPHRITVKLALEGAIKDAIELRGDLEYDAASQRLSVEDFDFTSDSEGILAKQLDASDRSALRKRVAKEAHWSLGAESAQLNKAIGAALNSSVRDQVHVSGELTQLDVKDFTIDDEALSAKVILGGALQVEYTPR